MTFYRIQLYERGGSSLFDIQWFHAYMWFLMFLPWTLHWSIPSHVIPRAWNHTPEFRALILYTIVLHAILLIIVARFLRVLCKLPLIAIGAFLLLITSPTVLLYSDLLDSRYLGLLAGLPALLILIAQEPGLRKHATRKVLLAFFFSGFLIGVGQAIHYTELYLCGPFALVYFVPALLPRFRTAAIWKRLGAFVAGLVAWFGPVQWLSLQYHPFKDSMIGTLIFQVDNHLSPYSRLTNLATWWHILIDEMGIPMMIAVVAGSVILIRDRWRPAYFTRVHARLAVWTSVIACAYFAWTPAFPFYRQLSGLQLFFALFAVVAIERAASRLRHMGSPIYIGAIATMYIAVAFLPSFVRGPEVFVAQQGLGRAVNLAYARASNPDRVHFMATYDWDPNPKAILSRADFDALRDDDYIVTDYPIFYHVKYPDIFALLYDTKPIGAFPTEWCTQEIWAELRSYFWFRRWYDEPANCEAQVFRVADFRAAERGTPLSVSQVTADSTLTPQQGPDRVLALRNPSGPLDDNYFGRELYSDQWVSNEQPGPHWLQVTFAKAARIGAVTVVPPDWIVPPDFLYTGRFRIDSLKILGDEGNGFRQLWYGHNLENDVIFTATWAPVSIRRMRFVIEQHGPPANHAAALMYLRFPGYVVTSENAGVAGAAVHS